MSEPETKPIRCMECGYIVGKVMRGEGGVRQLAVFRYAMDDEIYGQLGGGSEDDVVAVFAGGRVNCGACGSWRSWYLDEYAIEEILHKNGRKG